MVVSSSQSGEPAPAPVVKTTLPTLLPDSMPSEGEGGANGDMGWCIHDVSDDGASSSTESTGMSTGGAGRKGVMEPRGTRTFLRRL